MAGQCLTALVLAFILSAGSSLADVDQNWLTQTVEGIKNEYALGDTFSLAVNIPQNQDLDSLQQVLQDDSADKVKETVSQGQVYKGTRVVAATQSDALSRVLENIQPFIKSSEGNFLIIYSEESPCGTTCTNANEDGIASKINDIIQNWQGYAFVFSKVVNNAADDTSQQAQSFKQLTISKLGLDNIFCCYQPEDEAFQCTSCSSGGYVTPSCLANTNQSPADIGKQLINKIVGIDEEVGAGIGRGIAARIGRGAGQQGVEEKPGQVSKCKGREGECKPRRGVKRRGGKVGKGKRRGGKGKKQGKLQGGHKKKLRKGAKVKKCSKKDKRGGRKLKKGGKRRKGGKHRE